MNTAHIELARAMAHKSTGKYRLGAVVVKRRRVVSTGLNWMGKTHPIMQKFNVENKWTPGIHAEVHACLGVPIRDLIGAELYVVRIMRNGLPALAKPCLICQRFLRSVGVQKVYYSTLRGLSLLELDKLL